MLKLAVPTRGGQVDEHFGHCESFTIYSIDDSKAVVNQERFTPPPACGCKSNLIPTLVEMGVSVLVAGNMGEGAVQRLIQAGIKVFRGAKGDVGAAVQSWIEGKLVDSKVVCLEHGAAGHVCSHGH
ncbi:MAG TPA: NifB/NifX family molybdenum-iron cluster-binding protein [Humidesulfovibrio sp.]|uniref:NifB/NifX family molybdenum-iron cluster-binding protein n=1 Tax=Humidesulfovibrio sp. TaxID=2910988 RepID=UPI002C333A30|nr:NifB/NifX family molybdenum-iron cluster-binding protein [Humidesulfovibrio sp.]HWR03714.1 NifB/NifX family molybdenum-iron cluster-binding protein [Humidesulfovibrio sp.]